MKRFLTVLLALMLVLGLMVPSFALAYSNDAPIVGNDGLLVMSPEEYLGIEECDKLYANSSDHYTYVYSERGMKDSRHGTDNPVDWYKMEDYIDALVDSGYYEVLEHEKPLSGTDYWYLGYTGPGSVTRTFHFGTRVTTDAAIIIRSFYGNIEVAYSLDIMTNDIEETQSRLGKSIFVSDPSDGSGSKKCGRCYGSGNCSFCGGSGRDSNLLAGTTTWLSQDCLHCGGSGDCSLCYGSGER